MQTMVAIFPPIKKNEPVTFCGRRSAYGQHVRSSPVQTSERAVHTLDSARIERLVLRHYFET